MAGGVRSAAASLIALTLTACITGGEQAQENARPTLGYTDLTDEFAAAFDAAAGTGREVEIVSQRMAPHLPGFYDHARIGSEERYARWVNGYLADYPRTARGDRRGIPPLPRHVRPRRRRLRAAGRPLADGYAGLPHGLHGRVRWWHAGAERPHLSPVRRGDDCGVPHGGSAAIRAA